MTLSLQSSWTSSPILVCSCSLGCTVSTRQFADKKKKATKPTDEPGLAEFEQASDLEYDSRDFEGAEKLYKAAIAKGNALAAHNYAL